MQLLNMMILTNRITVKVNGWSRHLVVDGKHLVFKTSNPLAPETPAQQGYSVNVWWFGTGHRVCQCLH